MNLKTVRRRVALGAVGLLVAAGGAIASSGPAYAAVACNVTYQTAWSGGGGFGANITINNVGDPLNGWTLTFAFPGAQTVTQGWSATWSQSGANVTATSMSWNGNVPTGGSVSIGFNGTFTGANAAPTTFAINGVTCNGAQQPTQSLVVSPTAVTVPEGGSATYGVRLAAQPTNNVTVTSAAGTGDANLTVTGGASLTFTPANWNTAQNVTVSAAQDADTTNGTRPITVASTGLPSVTVTATEADDDPPTGTQAIQVTPTSVRVPEGSTAVYGVRLAIAPTANVTVTSTLGAGDTNITISSGASLTFTPANFATPQNVTLAAAQDADDTDGSRTITVASTGLPSVTVTATEADDESTENSYITEFVEQYDKLKNPANGYFSPEGVPYHSVETLLVEAPDHGHETTSEAFSFYIWLEAQYGRVTGNWAPFNTAWNITEQFIIPSAAGQPGGSSGYNPSDPADYAPEFNQPSQYPSPLDANIVAGQDPLSAELQSTYGNRNMYAMHWLLDVDDVYGFGRGTGNRCGDTTQRVTYINTYQRGPQESVWETVPHPSCETQQYGQAGQGYPPLFIAGTAAAQWRYTAAPDADARAVQAAYWALTWATEQGNQSQITTSLSKAAKMGDFLRYAMYDKYFKNPGCASPTCAAGSGKSSSAYLLNWYFAWGGAMDSSWAWRIGSSHNHGGYQNPLAAWVLSPAGPTALRPQSPTAAADWNQSLTRQVQFYAWLQSAEGAIAGGATNSWDGAYAARPAGAPQFFGMSYDVDPVYHDPPSNQWFGFQAWGMQRLAELYYVIPDGPTKTLAKSVLDKWVAWAISQTTLGAGSTYSFPSDMSWSGAPAGNFNSATGTPAANPGLHVSIINRSNDVGVAAAYARTLIYYAAEATGTTLGTQAQATAKGLLDRMLMLKDSRGISVTETRGDYERFNDVWSSSTQKGLYVPPGFTGTMPNGDPINSSSTFLSIRSFYQNDPEWAKVQAHLNGGPAPTFNYHRFWAQADFAMALADYGHLFPNG
jgi:hypothetical protein